MVTNNKGLADTLRGVCELPTKHWVRHLEYAINRTQYSLLDFTFKKANENGA